MILNIFNLNEKEFLNYNPRKLYINYHECYNISKVPSALSTESNQ